MSERIPITPETKVGPLLDGYPELEPVLIGMAPAFGKLRNPVLRRTIARVTTLATAAKVADIAVQDMVRTLREAAGLATSEGPAEGGPGVGEPAENTPAWLSNAVIVETIGADALLSSDITPLQVVMPKARALSPDQVLCVRSSFRPEPLIEALREKRHPVHCAKSSDGTFETFVLGKRQA